MSSASAALPSINDAADLCNAAALLMSQAAMAGYREVEDQDIAEYDQVNGDEDVPDPLLTAHRYGRFYLQCAGDFVYSIGQLLALEAPMVMSPAVLARSAAEYSSRTWYITDPSDGPETRVAKIAQLLRAGFLERGFLRPNATFNEKELLARLERWSQRQQLTRMRSLQYDKLVADMIPEYGKREYDWLSGYVHASAATIGVAYINAASEHVQRREDAWRYAIFASGLGLMAAERVSILRKAAIPHLADIQALHTYYLVTYNACVHDDPLMS